MVYCHHSLKERTICKRERDDEGATMNYQPRMKYKNEGEKKNQKIERI